MNTAMIRANAAYKVARTHLALAVRAALPVGTRIEVELGRFVVRGVIIEHGPEWVSPATVTFVNERTGKRRRFTATHDSFLILEASEQKAKPRRVSLDRRRHG